MSNDKLAEALEIARNGLLWYQDRYPNEVNGCDDEAMATIDAALQAHAADAAQAQAQTAEPVGEVVGVTGSVGEMRVIRWRGRYSPEVGTKLYTHPQPAQDASKYQELLMAVEKKFPGESRHETALRYIRETELQSCEPKCDAAMAKEAGNG